MRSETKLTVIRLLQEKLDKLSESKLLMESEDKQHYSGYKMIMCRIKTYEGMIKEVKEV